MSRKISGLHILRSIAEDEPVAVLIDKMVMKNCRRRRTSLNMAWICYKKASYDMVPHS